jgi:low affinity Fe/Cu permease
MTIKHKVGDRKVSWFSLMSKRLAEISGKAKTFMLAAGIIVLWGA